MSNFDLIFDNKILFKDYFLFDEENAIEYIPKFNSINIVVGSNNSGKSRFMRSLMSLTDLYLLYDFKKIKRDIHDYNDFVKSFNRDVLDDFINMDRKNPSRIHRNGIDENREKAKTFEENKLEHIDFNDFKQSLNIITKNKLKLSQLSRYGIRNDYLSNFEEISKDSKIMYSDKKRYYIPTLRTAHSLFQISKLNLEVNSSDKKEADNFKKIEDDVYMHTYLKNYNIDSSIQIFTGLHLYREILNARNSKKQTRLKFEKFQDFIGNNFFDGKKIDIVAEFKKEDNLNGKNDNEIISIDIEGDDNSRDLYDLGDGIQALIVLMYKIFMAESESFIFIDEPEINLHPGMQRLFLEQITLNKDLTDKNLVYIITTHSNHFLDLTIEKDNVSIYSFSPRNNELNKKQFTIKNVNRGDNSILKELGVNNSSVFMANCSIWVEGISDRNYVKAFLKSYCESIGKSYPKEDIDFAFFEYAGSNIDHYIFDDEIEKEDVDIVLKDIKALAISNRIFLLADSDASKQSTKKGIRLKELEEAKTDNFVPKIIWNVREIENLLNNDIWKEILVELCKKTLVESHKDEILIKIDEALSEVDSSNFMKKYVGEFLEEIRNKMGKISSSFILNQSTYEVKSKDSFGTISNKRELSELVFNKNFSWKILSRNKEIEELTIEIYNFITRK